MKLQIYIERKKENRKFQQNSVKSENAVKQGDKFV